MIILSGFKTKVKWFGFALLILFQIEKSQSIHAQKLPASNKIENVKSEYEGRE